MERIEIYILWSNFEAKRTEWAPWRAAYARFPSKINECLDELFPPFRLLFVLCACLHGMLRHANTGLDEIELVASIWLIIVYVYVTRSVNFVLEQWDRQRCEKVINMDGNFVDFKTISYLLWKMKVWKWNIDYRQTQKRKLLENLGDYDNLQY